MFISFKARCFAGSGNVKVRVLPGFRVDQTKCFFQVTNCGHTSFYGKACLSLNVMSTNRKSKVKLDLNESTTKRKKDEAKP